MEKLLGNMRLKKIFKQTVATIVLGATVLFSSPVMAMPEIMPLSEIQEGMSGTGWTVIDSSGEIVPFGVEIIGIAQGGKGTPAAIVAKASGPVIDSSGGIIHGMSGSPVYIDGLLIGAAAATMKDMEPTTFIITPIEEMLKIWDLPDNKKPKQITQVDFKKVNEDREKRLKKEAEEKAKKEAEQAEKDGKATETDPKKDGPSETKSDGEQTDKEKQPVDTQTEQPAKETAPRKIMPLNNANDQTGGREPEYKGTLFAAGFDPVSYADMEKKLRPLGFKTVAAGGFKTTSGSNTIYDATLQPGSSFAIAVVHGDFLVGGMGTVTAMDGNRLLGFGHSMLGKGNVSYFLAETDVLGTVKGLTDGMKIGNVKKVIGRINQDRSTGVGGILGEFPSVVGVRVNVEDKTVKANNSYAASVAYDEAVLPILANGIAYAALNKTVDSQAESTVKVHFDIMTNAVADGKIERDNMFYVPGDVGQQAFNELTEAIGLVCSNTDKESDIFDIKVELTSESERKTAVIVSAVPDRPKVRPGDTVIFKTTIKPYRSETVKLDIPFTVPKNRKDGRWTLDMHGGGLIAVPLLLMNQAGVINPDAPIPTTEEKINELLERHSNNQIIVEPGIAQQLMSEKEQAEAIKEAIELSKAMEKGEAPPEPPISVFDTDYVIENVIHAVVEVDKKAPLPEKKEDKPKADILDGLKLGKSTNIQDQTKDLMKEQVKENAAEKEKGSAKAEEKEPVPAETVNSPEKNAGEGSAAKPSEAGSQPAEAKSDPADKQSTEQQTVTESKKENMKDESSKEK